MGFIEKVGPVDQWNLVEPAIDPERCGARDGDQNDAPCRLCPHREFCYPQTGTAN